MVHNVQQRRWRLGPVGLRGSIVITEEATHPLAALHAAVLTPNLPAVDQLVTKSLMVALAMVIDHELGERTPEVSPNGISRAVCSDILQFVA